MTERRRPKLFFVAAEPSGDALGEGLVRALRARLGDGFDVVGVGGPRLEAVGVVSPFDIRDLSVLGVVEGVRAYPRVIKSADETADLADAERPDAAILIDSWGFTLRVAQRLRRRLPGLPIIKYVGPQVWASRPGRAKTLAAVVDHVLTLQPFEPPYFERAGLAATFVGHPVFDAVPRGDGAAFRRRYAIGTEERIVLILLGSRSGEVARLAEPFAAAIECLRVRYGDTVRCVAPIAASVATQARAAAVDHPGLQEAIFVEEADKDDAFAAASAALACSGTVTSELALAGVPAVVAYKMSPLSYAIASVLVTAPHISLVNMAAGERVFPEFVQGAARGPELAEAVGRLLDDEVLRARTLKKAALAIDKMRGEGRASDRAAEAVIEILSDRGVRLQA